MPSLSMIFLAVYILKEIMQLVTERKDYLTDFFNISDLICCVLVSICQFYYWRTGRLVNGFFFPEEDSYFEEFLLPAVLVLHLNLIL